MGHNTHTPTTSTAGQTANATGGHASDDSCPKCGMPWTLPGVAWQPLPPRRGVEGCGCASHADPLENEKMHHGNGRHGYRAYTKAQAGSTSK